MVDLASLTHPPTAIAPCAFCARSARPHIMRETPDFYLLADIAPVVEGHMLIIARPHLACLGALPPALDATFLALKDEVGRFLRRTYGREPLFWEHGIFGQSVFHLHMHCIPLPLPDIVPATGTPVGAGPDALGALRGWFAERGHYWYAEQAGRGYLCPPDPDAYRAANAAFDAAMDLPAEHRPFWDHRDALRRRGDGLIRKLLVKWFADQGV